MSDSEQEQGKSARSTGTKQFWSGFSLGILFVFSAANIFLLLFIVPKFEQIFADTLPGKPLPGVTEFIITYRIALAFVAFGWPIMGAILVKMQKRYAILLINLVTIWTLLQVGITVFALFLPMEYDGIVGMSDSNHP